MRRREFISFLGGAAVTPVLVVRTNAAEHIARVGIIDDLPAWDPFRQQLRELGYVDGKNIAFEYRRADGVPDRLFAAASELVQIPVDVIAVYGTPAAQAAQQATKSIPIVAISIGDPIAAGLVSGFGRPGDNITGNTILGTDVVTKRLQILKDAIPSVSRVAFLWNPDNASNGAILQALLKAVPLFHLTLISLEARTAEDFDTVFAQILSERPDAVLMTNDPFHQTQMHRVIDFLLKNQIAGLFQIRQNVADGGLMSYGASFSDLFRRSALYVDKIYTEPDPETCPSSSRLRSSLSLISRRQGRSGLQSPRH